MLLHSVSFCNLQSGQHYVFCYLSIHPSIYPSGSFSFHWCVGFHCINKLKFIYSFSYSWKELFLLFVSCKQYCSEHVFQLFIAV